MPLWGIISQTGGGTGNVPVTPNHTHTAAGAINVADNYILLQPGSGFTAVSPMAMTLANGTVNTFMLVKLDGPGAATITGNFDRQSGKVLSFYSPNGRGAAWLWWDVGAATWLVQNVYDPGLEATDLPTAGTLTGSEVFTLNQLISSTATDVEVALSTIGNFLNNQPIAPVALAANATLTSSLHNRKDIYQTVPALTLNLSNAATLGNFRCCYYTLAGQTVTFSGGPAYDLQGNVVTSIPASTSMEIKTWGGTIYALKTGTVSAATTPVLSIATITGQTPGGTSTAVLSFANGAPSTLTATLDGAALTIGNVTINTTQGSGPTASGNASFTFITPAAGTHSIQASSSGAYATVSNTYTLQTSSSPLISVSSVTPTGATIINAIASGTFANGAPASLTATMDGTSLTITNIAITTTTGSGATASGTWSFNLTNPAVGSHTLVVTGTGTYAGTSTGYQYSTASATISVNAITAPAPNTTFTVSGAYSQSTWTPAGIQYSTDNTTWTTATSPTIGGGSWSFAITGGLAVGTYTLYVRGTVNTQITANSNSFTIAAAGGTITAPGSSTAGVAASFPVTVTGSGNPTLYASVTSGGTEQTPRTPVPFGSTTVSMTPTVAAASTASLYLASSGGSAIANSGSFTPAASGGYPVIGSGTVQVLLDMTTGVTTSGGNITQITDQSANNFVFTPQSGAVFHVGANVNGHPTLVGDAANNGVTYAVLGCPGSINIDSMKNSSSGLVAFKTGSAVPTGALWYSLGAFGNGMEFVFQTSGNLFLNRNSSPANFNQAIISSPLSINTVYKVVYRWNLATGALDVWMNGTKTSYTEGSGSNNPINASVVATFGGSTNGGQAWSLTNAAASPLVGENWWSTGIWTDAEVTSVNSYLNTKWGS